MVNAFKAGGNNKSASKIDRYTEQVRAEMGLEGMLFGKLAAQRIEDYLTHTPSENSTKQFVGSFAGSGFSAACFPKNSAMTAFVKIALEEKKYDHLFFIVNNLFFHDEYVNAYRFTMSKLDSIPLETGKDASELVAYKSNLSDTPFLNYFIMRKFRDKSGEIKPEILPYLVSKLDMKGLDLLMSLRTDLSSQIVELIPDEQTKKIVGAFHKIYKGYVAASATEQDKIRSELTNRLLRISPLPEGIFYSESFSSPTSQPISKMSAPPIDVALLLEKCDDRQRVGIANFIIQTEQAEFYPSIIKQMDKILATRFDLSDHCYRKCAKQETFILLLRFAAKTGSNEHDITQLVKWNISMTKEIQNILNLQKQNGTATEGDLALLKIIDHLLENERIDNLREKTRKLYDVLMHCEDACWMARSSVIHGTIKYVSTAISPELITFFASEMKNNSRKFEAAYWLAYVLYANNKTLRDDVDPRKEIFEIIIKEEDTRTGKVIWWLAQSYKREGKKKDAMPDYWKESEFAQKIWNKQYDK